MLPMCKAHNLPLGKGKKHFKPPGHIETPRMPKVRFFSSTPGARNIISQNSALESFQVRKIWH